jgi:hypothetical protein
MGWQLWSTYGHQISLGPEFESAQGSLHTAPGDAVFAIADFAWTSSGLNLFAFGDSQRHFQSIAFAKSAVASSYSLVLPVISRSYYE